MGLFSFTQELAMDLGTANSVIVNNAGKILLDEPSIVALDRKTDKMIALGEKARQMHGKTHENIRTVRPLRDGVIADFNAAEQMIRGMIKMANKNKGGLFSPSLRVVICIPSGSWLLVRVFVPLPVVTNQGEQPASAEACKSRKESPTAGTPARLVS